MGGTPDLNNRETRGVRDGIELLHIHRDPHPRMDATLEAVKADGQPSDLQGSARRKRSRVDGTRSQGALRGGSQSAVERGNPPSSKVRNLGKGMPSPALVSRAHRVANLDREIGGVVPPRRMTDRGQ